MNDEMILMMAEDKEIWSSIEGFEGYEISTYGRVRSYWKHIGIPNGVGTKSIISNTYKIKDISYTDKNQRSSIILRRNKKSFCFRIHRLVANTFIPNPYKLAEVDHIDRNPSNNRVSNLRWCSRKQNTLNTKLQVNNTSGFKGIRFRQDKQAWQARWQENGVSKCKSFDTQNKAIEYRNKMIEKYYDTNFYNPK